MRSHRAIPLRISCLLLLTLPLAAGIARARHEIPDTPLDYGPLKALSLPDLKLALERAGWPVAHVRALLDVEIQSRLGLPPLQPSDLHPFEFWRTGPDCQPLPPKAARARAQEAVRRETTLRATYDALFPAVADNDPNSALARWEEQRRWGSLSGEKRAAVSALLARAESTRASLFDARGGMLTRTEWDLAWKIQDDCRTALARLLSSDELLDYDLRNSATAESMRAELDNFQPSRAEFITIFRIRHPLELRFGHQSPGIDPAIDRNRSDATREIEVRLASALGRARYEEYCLSRDAACQTLQFDGRFVEADAATIRALYRSVLATKSSLAALKEPPGEKRAATEAALKDNLYRAFRAVFDEEGARRYLQEQALWP